MGVHRNQSCTCSCVILWRDWICVSVSENITGCKRELEIVWGRNVINSMHRRAQFEAAILHSTWKEKHCNIISCIKETFIQIKYHLSPGSLDYLADHLQMRKKIDHDNVKNNWPNNKTDNNITIIQPICNWWLVRIFKSLCSWFWFLK